MLTSYILASAVAIPITGWLADRFGTRRLFIVSVALFVLASMLCGVAQSLEQMVIFRALQGLGGAFLGPLAQSLMLDINKPSQQARAMSVYGWASWSARSWGRSSAAGLPRISTGAGASM